MTTEKRVETWGLRTYVTREMREYAYSPIAIENALKSKVIAGARREGYEPVADAYVDWVLVTALDKQLDRVPAFLRVGDWQVFTSVRTVAVS